MTSLFMVAWKARLSKSVLTRSWMRKATLFMTFPVRTTTVAFGKDQPIIPGMTVEVDILTGKKTIMAYLMKPVLRAQQRSLSER
jgi:multidrug efflux pump subunit AcrA (membrane-fusion protein)